METRWVPFTLAWDDHVPVDLSFVYEREKPAGKHGFLTVKGNRLVFEDGTEGRFWGTCFNSGANFPPHEHSENGRAPPGQVRREHDADAPDGRRVVYPQYLPI